MPLTRSKKSVKPQETCRESTPDAPFTTATDVQSLTSSKTSRPSSRATNDNTLRGNEAAEATEPTVSTVRRMASAKGRTSEHSGISARNKASTHRASEKVGRSVSSTDGRKRRELQARAEVHRQKLELANIELALSQLNEEDKQSAEESDSYEEDVQKWVNSTVGRISDEEHGEQSDEGQTRKTSAKGQIPEHSPARHPERERDKEPHDDGRRNYLSAKPKAFNKGAYAIAAPPAFLHELPLFDGTGEEWLAFKTVYEDTAPFFSNIQNMARLRKAITGNAREAVKSHLYSDALPEEIIVALQRRFGRPDALILAELDKIKRLPRVSENAHDICVFASTVANAVATVRGLKKTQYLYSPEMLKSIVDKMPAILRFRWYDFAPTEDDTNLLLMSKFLDREADRCGPYAQQVEVTRRQPPPRQAVHTTTYPSKNGEEMTCPLCQEDHRLFECNQFKKTSVQERWEIAVKTKTCFKCLRSGHRKGSCKKPPCQRCKRSHHLLLHEMKLPEQNASKQEEKKEVANNVRLAVNATKMGRVYLKMIPVEIHGPKGSTKVLALLDEGSTVTLLESSIAKEVGLIGPTEYLSLETVGGKIISKKDSMRVNMKIRGTHQRTKRDVTGVRTIDDLNLTPQVLDRARIEECNHLSKLVDQLYYEGGRPKLLIGQDNWNLIVSRSIRKGKKDQPVASLTQLGWVLHGSDGRAMAQVNFLSCAHVSTQANNVEKLISDHFAIESLGVLPRRPSTDVAEKAKDLLEKTVKRLESGQFEAGLLWKMNDDKMPDNFKHAITRLKNIEKKLDRNEDMKVEYSKQVQNLFDNNYAEEVEHDSASQRKWYLPHFAVTHPTKNKMRVVFDAASKFEGKSLNDALLTGPDLLQSLFGVLLRFRQHPVAVVADIKEMFLQVKIRKEDRDSLRFLWRGDQRTGTPNEYRMTSVIFGAACSPSTAIFVMNKNASEFQDQWPKAAHAIVRNHYMDDYLQSFEDEDEAIRTAGQVDTIQKKAGFQLRGWVSNKLEVVKRLTDETNFEEGVELGSKEEKTLGLRWFTKDDEIGFRTSILDSEEECPKQGKIPSKRMVLSAVMSTFDPMGLVAPVLIQGKRLLQDIWRSGIEWDEEITQENLESWRKYLQNVQQLKRLRIPRPISNFGTGGEMHVFTDASEIAYACSVYWRQRVNEKQYQVTLLAAKARVTPLKPVSIPRLELQAALMGTRLARSVEEELDIKPEKKIYWTDSSTVLSWIKSDPRTFKPFVAHRLAEIEDTTKPRDWRWVPTSHNPADDATRDIPENFSKNHRWFEGPAFLSKTENFWPKDRIFKQAPTGEEKEKFVVASVKITDKNFTPDSIRFSRWIRLLRASARVLQFIDACRRRNETANVTRKQENEDPTWRHATRKSKKKSFKSMDIKAQNRRLIPLEPFHLEKAEKLLLKRCQEESFGEDINLIRKKRALSRSSKLKKLLLEVDEDLLRIHGRIDVATSFEKSFKRPVVLDGKNHITRLLVHHYHTIFNHGNHGTVMNELRQRYWILGLRSLVRSVTHQCQWCRVRRNIPNVPPTGDLPKERLQPGQPPFSFTGVDLFGPMIVTVGRRHEKRWGALFTCLSTRAVSLELVSSLSADSTIMALRRMAARRGMPKGIFSDNGTNFVKANKELQKALEEMKTDIVTEAEKLGVRWKFIAPGAPNMGGAWERLVRSVKAALAVTLRERFPKEEVLHTVLLEAEHIVNSRPLVDAADDGEVALTPNHFLIGRSCGVPRLGNFTDCDLKGRQTWKISQRLTDHFWTRWVKEYLPTLIPRKIRGEAKEIRQLRCGDIVLIVDSTLPRNTWPRGEICQTYPGPDGRIRIVDVRTNGGTMRRPTSKIVLLVSADDTVQREDDDPSATTKSVDREDR